MRLGFICAVFVSACVSRPVLVPSGGGRYGLASDNSISLVADTRAWDGNPSDLEDYATPIAVEIHNGSTRAVVLHLENVTLEDNLGGVYSAWQIAGRKDTPPAPPAKTRIAPENTPAPQLQPVPAPEPTPMPPSSAPVQPTSAASPYEQILWSPDDLTDYQLARGPAPSRSYGGGGRSAPSQSYGGGSGRSYSAPPRSYSTPRSYGGYSGRSYSSPRNYTPSPRGYSGGYGYQGYGGYGGYGYGGAWNGYGYGYSYRPYWYGTPGFSPYWGLYGPNWGWGWGYTVYMGPNAYWGGSIPPERTDIVRLGLVDGTLQPGADVRGFVYFPALKSDQSSPLQSIKLRIPVYDATSNDVAADLQTQFSVLTK